jgi:hypothetical protein
MKNRRSVKKTLEFLALVGWQSAVIPLPVAQGIANLKAKIPPDSSQKNTTLVDRIPK